VDRPTLATYRIFTGSNGRGRGFAVDTEKSGRCDRIGCGCGCCHSLGSSLALEHVAWASTFVAALCQLLDAARADFARNADAAGYVYCCLGWPTQCQAFTSLSLSPSHAGRSGRINCIRRFLKTPHRAQRVSARKAQPTTAFRSATAVRQIRH